MITTIPQFSSLQELPLLHQGKVRNNYAINDELMLMVSSDRLSAFDVILPDPIPNKGAILNQLSTFWFDKTQPIIANHLVSELDIKTLFSDPDTISELKDRSVIVKRLKPVPIEAIVRGYIIGSGWKDYQQTGAISGIKLPAGLTIADKLPTPIFTPSTKANVGDHDENIDFTTMTTLIDETLANQIKQTSLKLFKFASEFALAKGIIIADTKFEFGLDKNNELVLMDEIFTPDSSRFWSVDDYKPGISPPSFDKQFVRDYLETCDWDKTAPGPKLPADIIEKTTKKYQQIQHILMH